MSEPSRSQIPAEGLPRLGVVYDRGAASVTEIVMSVRTLAAPVFLLADSEHATAQQALVEKLCETHLLPNDPSVMLDLAAGLHLDGVVTFAEGCVRMTAMVAERLGLSGMSVATADLLRDKRLQRARLGATGVDAIRLAEARLRSDLPDAVAVVGIPCVVKPVEGQESRHTYLVADPEEIEGLPAKDADGPFLVEEYLVGVPTDLVGDYVSVEMVLADGVVLSQILTGKTPLLPPFREVAQFWPSGQGQDSDAEIRRLATAAVFALGLNWGVAHVELKLTRQGPRIIEVNGRLGGLINEIARRAGIDLIAAAAEVALGRTPQLPHPRTERVLFHYTMPAPTAACRLVGVEGVKEVTALAGVGRYYHHLAVGDPIEGGVSTCTLNLVSGSVSNVKEMHDVMAEIDRIMSFTFELPDGIRMTLSGTELREETGPPTIRHHERIRR